MFNLKGWKYLFTFGESLLVFAKGNRRVGIDRETTELVIHYNIK